MDNSNHRPRLGPKQRRIPINLTILPSTRRALSKIGRGNCSAAVDQLVTEHLERKRLEAESIPEPEVA